MPLLDHLTEGDTVHDIGCASGRDLLWLKQRGFDAIGFEKSKGLAELARENAGCPVFEGDFETYEFSDMGVDAVLLVGALVHVPHEKFENILRRISDSLKEAGKMLITLKEGTGSFTDDRGRVLYLWKDSQNIS
jgi:SAM-dependent methyltransferase